MHRTTHKISVALFNVMLETNQERFSSLEIAQEGAYSQWSPEKMWVHARWRGKKKCEFFLFSLYRISPCTYDFFCAWVFTKDSDTSTACLLKNKG